MIVNNLLYGTLNQLRSTLFRTESLLLPVAGWLGSGEPPRPPFQSVSEFLYVRRSLQRFLRLDAERIAGGLAPASVLWSGEPLSDPVSHFSRLPKIFGEAVAAARRRGQKRAKEFSAPAARLSKKLPAYYRRNFHFQRDGYLSAESAEIYDHQVEMLFGGAADPMRRLVLVPLRDAWGTGGGKGKKILELGCGAGSATAQLKAAFPEAEITALDLSAPYVKQAAARVPGVKFRAAAAEKLPFAAEKFDAVVSVFLFHELPLEVRKAVLRESFRVLRSEGIFAEVDSLQLGDDARMNGVLRRFPANFHEPFYPNYLQHPMEELVAEAGFTAGSRDTGFFSKMVAGQKPARRKKTKVKITAKRRKTRG